MALPSRYKATVAKDHPEYRKVPETWLQLNLTSLINLKENAKEGFFMDIDWINYRISKLQLMKLIDPNDPLCK